MGAVVQAVETALSMLTEAVHSTAGNSDEMKGGLSEEKLFENSGYVSIQADGGAEAQSAPERRTVVAGR